MDNRWSGLIPQPVSVRTRPGSLALSAMPDIRTAGTGPVEQTARAVAAVRHLLSRVAWPVPEMWPAPEASPGAGARPAGAAPCSVSVDAGLRPEAYRLAVTAGGISITAGGESGAIHAAQTLRQLLPADAWRAAPALALRPATTAGSFRAPISRMPRRCPGGARTWTWPGTS